MKHKAVYFLLAAICLIIFSIRYVPKHTWRAISWDGFGDTAKGMGVSMTTWKSVNGEAIVNETVYAYSSPEAARKDFQEILKDSRAIIESTKTTDDPPGANERVVKLVGNAQTGEGAVEIIKLQDKEIQHIGAGSVKYALAFEKALLKLNF